MSLGYRINILPYPYVALVIRSAAELCTHVVKLIRVDAGLQSSKLRTILLFQRSFLAV